MSMRVVIKTRRDTASNWTSVNPVLSLGEMGIETDTRKIKFGDGTTAWNGLQYISTSNGEQLILEDVDDRVSELLVAGSGIILNYDDNGDMLTISTSGNISQFTNDAGYLTVETNDLTSSVTWANVPDANITESSVVQHSGALKITESQIVDLQPYLLNVVEDVTPQLGGDLDINNNDIIGTGNINIDGNASVNAVSFDLLADPTITAGMMGWNAAEGSLNVGLDGDVNIHVGEHTLFRIRNNTVNTLYAGQAVYSVGIHNNSLIEAELYIANGATREIRFMGLVLENIGQNQKGYAINFGHIEDIDTRGNGSVNGATNLYDATEPAWVEGDILYVHPTVPGKLTKIEPKHSISAAIVMYVHQNHGRIFVRPTSYGHLDDNHDVNTSGVANLDGLVYNSSSEYWEPKHLVQSETTGITGSSTVNNIVIISQVDYDALGSYDSNTIYYIV